MKHLPFIFLLIFSSCSTKKPLFPKKDVCFLLYNLKTQEFEHEMGKIRCGESFPAASTFKVALSVMAFDSGLFKSETMPVFKWNGQKTMIENWNKNQTPTSWIRDSVVWMSQELTAKLGEKKIQDYLTKFNYGNEDFSGGLKYSWLTPAPFIYESMHNSLKITGYEQVTFLKKLWANKLDTSKESQVLTRKIMSRDLSPKGNELTGKTGSGFKNEDFDIRLGWFVGHLKTHQTEYIVVFNFSDKQKVTPGTFGGREAKENALKLLSQKGLW